MEIINTQLNNCNIVEIAGRIDSYTAPRIKETLNSLISEGRCNLVIDFQKVSFISSAGILAFVNAQKKCMLNRQGKLVITSIPQLVYSGFALAGFDQLFEFYGDSDTAVGSF